MDIRIHGLHDYNCLLLFINYKHVRSTKGKRRSYKDIVNRKENDNFLIRTRRKEIRYSFIVVTSRDLNASTIKIQKESITSPNIYIHTHFSCFWSYIVDKNGTIDYVRQSRAFRLRDEKKEEGEEENRGRPSRAKDLQTGREKVEKNSANNRRRKIEGADERLQSDARRGLDTGVGMERVSCVHHRDFLLWKMTRTDYKSTDCR